MKQQYQFPKSAETQSVAQRKTPTLERKGLSLADNRPGKTMQRQQKEVIQQERTEGLVTQRKIKGDLKDEEVINKLEEADEKRFKEIIAAIIAPEEKTIRIAQSETEEGKEGQTLDLSWLLTNLHKFSDKKQALAISQISKQSEDQHEKIKKQHGKIKELGDNNKKLTEDLHNKIDAAKEMELHSKNFKWKTPILTLAESGSVFTEHFIENEIAEKSLGGIGGIAGIVNATSDIAAIKTLWKKRSDLKSEEENLQSDEELTIYNKRGKKVKDSLKETNQLFVIRSIAFILILFFLLQSIISIFSGTTSNWRGPIARGIASLGSGAARLYSEMKEMGANKKNKEVIKEDDIVKEFGSITNVESNLEEKLVKKENGEKKDEEEEKIQ